MIILHLYLQPQFRNELFHIYFTTTTKLTIKSLYFLNDLLQNGQLSGADDIYPTLHAEFSCVMDFLTQAQILTRTLGKPILDNSKCDPGYWLERQLSSSYEKGVFNNAMFAWRVNKKRGCFWVEIEPDVVPF